MLHARREQPASANVKRWNDDRRNEDAQGSQELYSFRQRRVQAESQLQPVGVSLEICHL